MIVVGIVAVLARFAMPAYADFSRRGMLPEATSTLATYAARMELYYQDNRTYRNAAAAGWLCGIPAQTMQNFALTCAPSSDGQSYTATATGNDPLTTGFAYTIGSSGVQATTAIPRVWGTRPARASTEWIVKRP